MNEMVAQMRHDREEMQFSPPPRTETKVSKHSKKTPQTSPSQNKKQKKLEIVNDLSTDIKKIKPPNLLILNLERMQRPG